jgi:hypothetical protein
MKTSLNLEKICKYIFQNEHRSRYGRELQKWTLLLRKRLSGDWEFGMKSVRSFASLFTYFFRKTNENRDTKRFEILSRQYDG